MADRCIDVDVKDLEEVPDVLQGLFTLAKIAAQDPTTASFLHKYTRTENHFETLMEHISRIATPHLVKWIEVGK